jgi:tetratricopeptide (TPR) repeat protein
MKSRREGAGVVILLCVLTVLLFASQGLCAQEDGPLARASALHGEVLRLNREGRYVDAIPKVREALALREQALGPTHPDVAESLNSLAELLATTGDYAGARPLYERGLRIREQALGPTHPDVAQSLNAFGAMLTATGDYAGARPMYERALRIREQALGPAHPDVAQSLNNLALLLAMTGDYAGARPLYERALLTWEQARGPTHPDVAVSLNNLALLLATMGDYAAARPLYERALRIREQALGPTHPDVAQSLNSFAALLATTGDYAGARPLFDRALRIWEQALGPTHPGVAQSLNNLAALLQTTGDYAGARPLYDRALRINEQALGPTHPDVAVSLNNLAELLRTTGDYAGARPLYERALRVWEQALGSTHPDVAVSLNSLALLFATTGDYAGARPLYERALQINEQALGAAHPDVAGSLNNLAALLQTTGDYAGARPLYERALHIREQALGPTHPDVAVSLNNLADLLQTTGDHAGARPLHERALRIREQALGPMHPDVAGSLNNLAVLLQTTGDYAGARPLYERALGIARTGGDPETLWRSLGNVAASRARDGKPLEALPLYREAVDVVGQLSAQFTEDVARTRYLEAENKLSVYDALATLLLQLHGAEPMRGYDREALAAIEAKKNRIVADALASARPTVQDPQVRGEVARARAERDRVAALERALAAEQAKGPAQASPERVQNLTTLLAKTKTEYLALVRPLVARYRQHASLFPDQQIIDPTTPAKFAGWLPTGTVAVGLFPSKDELYVFVVASGGVFRVKRQAIGQGQLFELVRSYRRLIAEGERRVLPWGNDGSQIYVDYVAPLKTVTAQLSEHLLGPIEEELRQYSNVIFMPNDLLLYLPFHALQRTSADATPRFLAETHVVSYLTQMEQAYLRPTVEAPRDVPLLAIANPDGTLAMAAREVAAVKTIRSRTTVLEGRQATKAAFLALLGQTLDTSDLHFATHGVLDAHRPERSYLLMAGADPKSRQLDIGEIRGLTLRVRLAMLSACETALAEDMPGAALVTLAAAFSEAGAETIVASLWKVEDTSARDTMVAFHSALRNVDRATALQQAQRSVMTQERTRHPFYWAPFLLIGAR